jgi:uncharacterized protein (TIGR02145 family)
MRLLLTALMVFLITIVLSAQDPEVKFYFNDGSKPKEYKIADIEQIDFIKSDVSYSMQCFVKGSLNAYNVKNINSIEFVDSNKLKINLSSSSKIIYIAEIDSIIFFPNIYCEIVIGTQTWMCKNLDVSTYRNGDTIPQVTDSLAWTNLKTGAWCYYNNDPAMGAIYGKLYNWYAVNDPRGLMPAGWHIPSYEEWKALYSYLGGGLHAGGKLKEVGTAHWLSPNDGATDEVGFTALPGGERLSNGTFELIGAYGFWWSSTKNYNIYAWYMYLTYNQYWGHMGYDGLGEGDGYGYSVRCVKD